MVLPSSPVVVVVVVPVVVEPVDDMTQLPPTQGAVQRLDAAPPPRPSHIHSYDQEFDLILVALPEAQRFDGRLDCAVV